MTELQTETTRAPKPGTTRLKLAMVTNIPVPYRLPVYENLANDPAIDLCVYFFSGREPDRHWTLKTGRFPHIFLREKFISFRERYIHTNVDIWGKLREFQPDVVITTGFNPSHLMAFLYARLHGARHIAMTDGTYLSEKKLSLVHRVVRRIVYAGSRAFLGPSEGAFQLYRSYGIDPKRVFKSHLCADNAAFYTTPYPDKKFDFIFCGRFVGIKNPLFAIDVALQTSKRLGRRTSLLFVGSGTLESQMRKAALAAADYVDCEFAGFADQALLPGLYSSARIFLFPTLWDPWGVVANEACAAGLPVLVTPVAGSAGELIRHTENGFVLPLELERWTDVAVQLLSDRTLYRSMSLRSLELVQDYSYANAATGIINAVAASTQDEPYPVNFPGGYRVRRKVVIIQRRMTHYRVPLFELMREQLRLAEIELIVVYGDPTPAERERNDEGQLAWGTYVPCVYLLNDRFCWQNAQAVVSDADLVIVAQENKLLFNLVCGVLYKKIKMAFWGHGRNFQATHTDSWSEYVKRWLLVRTDWWFTYTELSAKVVVGDANFSPERVTVLNNSTDTHSLADDLAVLTSADVQIARTSFGIGGGTIGIMIASLHADKKIDFLFQAVLRIRQRVPDFELVIVGDGPMRPVVLDQASRAGGWVHWMGARTGREKALLLKMAKIMLNPGMVGLGILDSFIAKVPLVTSDYKYHSPEIAYLENGINGLMTPDDVAGYADVVVDLINDEALYRKLQSGCDRCAELYSMSQMVGNFCEGIERCLNLDKSELYSAGSRAA